LGFNRYRRAFGVDFGKLGGRGCGYDSFRIHDKCPAKLKARGCRNALVSDAGCKDNARRWAPEGRRREAANLVPMLEALKHAYRTLGSSWPEAALRRRSFGRSL
jgi:hypothetical protein